MIRLSRSLRRSWYTCRQRLGLGVGKPNRLVVEKAAWLGDARSPVTLMVDDLANAWHNRRGGDRWEPGGDWGGGGWDEGSALDGLEHGLLRDFPEVRTTFFAVAGPISAYTHDRPFTHAAPLDADEKSRKFFAQLAADRRFELAYHGYNHGAPGVRTENFVQEWRGFDSREAALAQTRRGLEIFSRATGTVPSGGKYGGWEYNGFSDEVVESCGFTWWCRDWMPRDVSGRVPDAYYEPQFFGEKLLVALPSTVHGHLWGRRQLDLLLARRQVVGIEEHIAPVRPDGLVQTPNIRDDLKRLRCLFSYLRQRKVWHATASEIASYVAAREGTVIYDVTRDGFSLRCEGRRIRQPALTLVIDCAGVSSARETAIELVLPDGSVLDHDSGASGERLHRHVVTVPVQSGHYRVRPRVP